MKLVHQTKSGANTVYVFEDQGKRILKINQMSETHSIYNPQDPLVDPLEGHYWNFITMLPYLAPMRSACLLGLGAGTITRQLATYHPTLCVDGVEHDAEIITVASSYFSLSQSPLTIIHDDGVAFLSNTKTPYDLIILDAFEDGNLSPAFLNQSCFSSIAKRLSSIGIFAANYIFSLQIHTAIKELCKEVFPWVWLVQVADSSNYIIIGSFHKIDFSKLPTTEVPERLKPLAQYISHYTQELKAP